MQTRLVFVHRLRDLAARRGKARRLPAPIRRL